MSPEAAVRVAISAIGRINSAPVTKHSAAEFEVAIVPPLLPFWMRRGAARRASVLPVRVQCGGPWGRMR